MIPATGAFLGREESQNTFILKYNDILNEVSEYECDYRFVSTIQRKAVGIIQIAYMSDEYNLEKAEWIEAYCCYAYQEISNLGILQIFVPDCEKEDSQVGDIVLSEHLRIRTNGREFKLNEYIEYIGLSISGKLRILYCNSLQAKNDTDIGYLLAGETACSEHVDYKIRNEKLKELSAVNISKYDFYELYASQMSLVYLLRDFSEDFTVNLEKEALLIYICEVALLQNAAISRINGQIIDELMQNSNISARKTLKLQVEFGKTILLWDNYIYSYYMSQELSNDIVKAFGTDRLLEEYERNSNHIEQIASLKNGISSEIEGKILNILAFVLSIGQLIELIKNGVDYFKGYHIQLGVSGMGVALLIIILALIRKKQRHK